MHWRYSVDDPNINGVSWTTISPPGATFSTSETLASLSNGLHTVYAQYKDNNGNESVVNSATVGDGGDDDGQLAPTTEALYLPIILRGS